MTIEINLVGNSGQTFTNLFDLRARKRAQVETDEQVLSEIAAFLVDNIATIDAAVSDKGLVNLLQSVSTLSINDYMSLKFLLAQSGLDILAYVVAEQEVDSEGIERGINEYNIIDSMYPESTFLCRATKVAVDAESSHMSEIYQKIQDIYGFFDSKIFDGYVNPMSNQIKLIADTEATIGKAPEASTMLVNSMFEYMGKQIILMINTLGL